VVANRSEPAPTAPTPRPPGPLFDTVHRCLADRDEYSRFRAGALSREDFALFLDRMAGDLTRSGVPPEDVHFAKRYPVSITHFVDDVIADLARRGVIPRTDLDPGQLRGIEASAASLQHEGLCTYIYPEEARLLAALAQIVAPRRAIFLGSYYGYWAHWAVPAIVAAGGRAVLVDPDPRVQAVARTWLGGSRFAGAVELAVTTGERFLAETRDTFDLVVLDAEAPRDHPDPDQRGKRVYRTLFAHALSRLAPDALLVCHNILLSDHSGADFFTQVIERNREELGPFLALAEATLDGFVEYPSTEGVGIGWRRSA
jgi:predicted O-methyltransferase YrrM